jgi:gamma-glutamyltranspeptidase / glutathione hydrolase
MTETGRNERRVVTTPDPQCAQAALSARGGMVTANHRLAAEAGAGMLARGGNAIDAAAATAFAVGVVEPAMSGLGGRGYLVIHFSETGMSTVIDGHERAPMAASPDMFEVADRRERPNPGWGPEIPVAGQANIIGHRAVAVPGSLGAIALAHARYGRLPLDAVLEPAIRLADEGFEVTVALAGILAQHRAKLARQAAAAATFLPGGFPPAPGERLVQRDLARSLRLIARHGPDEFYTGSIARAIEEEMARGGGIITRGDLARFAPRVWAQPLTGIYRGWRVLAVPDATGGVTLLQILNLLEGIDTAGLDPFGPEYLHLLLEVFRVAFRDRLAVLDDPAFRPVPYEGLTSKRFAGERRRLLSSARALATVDPADPWPFDGAGADGTPAARLESWRTGAVADHDTTHFCVVDRARTVVSMTQSLVDAFGSGVVVPGTGILLNSCMHNFNPLPGQLRSIAPWKRSVHNGTPAIVLRPDGSPHLAIGGAGGTKIITGVAQILINVLDRGWTLQDAVAAPRVHNEGDVSEIDARVDPGVAERLRRMGHDLSVVTPRYARPVSSRINGIAIDAGLPTAGGALASGVDPFGDAGAAAAD